MMGSQADNSYTILITGASRGIGKGLLGAYLKRANTTVIAANRDIESDSSKALHELQRGSNSRLLLVKVEATNATDPARAVGELKSRHGIERIDLVIANAGISYIWPKVSELNVWDLQQHLDVNAYSVVWLWQAVLPLLLKAKEPKFVAVSSSAGSLSQMDKLLFPNSAYGTSKAALNYLVRKMHYEEERICTFPICPGWVQTELGNRGAISLGFGKAALTTEESITGVVKVIDAATRQDSSGKFWLHTGETQPY